MCKLFGYINTQTHVRTHTSNDVTTMDFRNNITTLFSLFLSRSPKLMFIILYILCVFSFGLNSRKGIKTTWVYQNAHFVRTFLRFFCRRRHCHCCCCYFFYRLPLGCTLCLCYVCLFKRVCVFIIQHIPHYLMYNTYFMTTKSISALLCYILNPIIISVAYILNKKGQPSSKKVTVTKAQTACAFHHSTSNGFERRRMVLMQKL